jgi:autotransporter-associated beta strand protein
LAVVAAVLVATPSVALAQYTWVPSNNNTGNWNATARWTGGPVGTFPNAVDASAIFNIPLSTAGTGNYNLQVSNTAGAAVTVGSVIINHNDLNTFNTRFGANGNGTITLQSSLGPATWTENTGLPTDSAANTNIFAPVTFGSNTVITANHALANNAAISFTSSNNSAGGITAAPGITLTKEGAGNVEFDVAPAAPGTGFQGAVVVNNGGVRIAANVFANASAVTVNSGGQFQLGSSTVTNWNLAPGAILSLSGAGKSQGANPEGALRFQNNAVTADFTNPVSLASDSTIYVAANLAPIPPAPVTYGQLGLSDVVSGVGGLTKTGPGILDLKASNTYAGTTSVNAGTLLANNTSGSATSNGAVVVNAGATLGGSGFITGAVTFLDGTLSPGNSPGTLTLGSTTFTAGSQLLFDLDTPNVIGGGINDLTEVNGNLLLAGTLAINPLAGFGAGTYRLFDYTGSYSNQGLSITGLSGDFLAILDDSIPGQVNLNVAAVPELSTVVLLGLGAVGMVLGARRRRAAVKLATQKTVA